MVLWVYFFGALLFLAEGILAGYYLYQMQLNLLSLPLHFLPCMVFFGAYLIARNQKRNLVHWIAVPVCLLCSGFGALDFAVIRFFHSTLMERCDIGEYADLVTKLKKADPKQFEHFPAEVPAQANNVRFSYQEHFLQGGGHLQLRGTFPQEAIDRQYAEFNTIKTVSYFGGDMFSHVNASPDGMPTTEFYTGEVKHVEFPKDYELLVLDRLIPAKERANGLYWNHGKSHGVAISKQRNEIIYWAEFW